jgi:hypothetical protein
LAALVYRTVHSTLMHLKERLRRFELGARWDQNVDGRAYNSPAGAEIAEMEALESILTRIAAGEPARANELLPYLCLESKEQRCTINAMLADAYVQAQTPEHLQQAKVFIQRAWLLSGGSADLLPLYTRIATALHDAESIRDAYKQLGTKAAARGDVSEAIGHFTSSHYAHLLINGVDKYEYDFDTMRCMDQFAAPHRFNPTTQVKFPDKGKIRLAHLVKGATELNSILVAIDLVLAKYYDKSRFEIIFFIPESEEEIKRSPKGSEYVKNFESFGWRVVTGPNLNDRAQALLDLARRIHHFRPHALITSAALADYGHYFVTSLRPAPIAIGLVQGPPPQFARPILDWREDFLRILPAADILIDTYPNGGGQVIVQAMSLEIPFVSHQNDYMGQFDQTNWSPVEDFIIDPEIIVPRGDFEQLKKVVSRLIEDSEYRAKVGERVRACPPRGSQPRRTTLPGRLHKSSEVVCFASDAGLNVARSGKQFAQEVRNDW